MKVSRREFLRVSGIAGGGLLLGLQLPLSGKRLIPASLPESHTLHLFIEIDNSGTVTVSMAKHEMGQGLETGIARIVAEELDADWTKVRISRMRVDAASHTVGLGLDDFGTGGSYSIRSLWTPLRQAGASVREMLRQAAAKRWRVGIDECITRQGFVCRAGSDDVLGYGNLAGEAAHLPIPQDPPMKAMSDFSLVGRSCERIDPTARVCGATPYSMDLEVPGMLHASLLRAPVKGGRLIRCDSAGAMSLPGVRQVLELKETSNYEIWAGGAKSSVAVLADSTWAAMKGREALVVEWDYGPNAERDAAGIFEEFADPEKVSSRVNSETGPVDENLSAGVRRFSACYHSPYLAHAMMEPLNAIASVHENNDVEVWVGTQNPYGAARHIARELGIDIKKVTIHPYPSGGGFGRRYGTDYILETVLLAKKAKVPVKLTWTREDEIQHGRYHPFRKDEYEVALDETGSILAWRFDGYTTHDWGAWSRVPVSAISHRSSSHTLKDKLVNYGAWRSVAKHLEVFSYECFIDELAHTLGKDPLKYRLQLLAWSEALPVTDDRKQTFEEYAGLTRVLRTVAGMADWGRKLPAGVGLGIGVGNYNDCYCAEIAEVEERNGEIRIRKVYCAVDCGIVIHPGQVEAQIEGGILWAMTPLLYGGIDIRKGAVVQSNFDDLEVLRVGDCPEIEVRILESNRDPVGVGEPSVPPLAPACLNAIYAATGKRIRSLPFTTGYASAMDSRLQDSSTNAPHNV